MKQWISYFRMEITQSSPKARTMIGAHNTQTYLRTHKKMGALYVYVNTLTPMQTYLNAQLNALSLGQMDFRQPTGGNGLGKIRESEKERESNRQM